MAACGGSSSDESNEGAAFTSLDACATCTYDYVKPESTSAGMTITYDIAPEAVWEDGSPITVADFAATWDASLNTPGSLSTTGYDQVLSVEAGSSNGAAVRLPFPRIVKVVFLSVALTRA